MIDHLKGIILNILKITIVLSALFISCAQEEDPCATESWEGVFKISADETDNICFFVLNEEFEFTVVLEGIISFQGADLTINSTDCTVFYEDPIEDNSYLITLVDLNTINVLFTDQGEVCNGVFTKM